MTDTPSRHRHRIQGHLLMLVSTVCFTANVLIIRALGTVESVDVWTISLVRFLAGIGLLLAAYRRETQYRRVFRQPRLALRGLVGGFAVCGFYLTIVHLGAGLATFIGNIYVILAALMAVVLLGERLRMPLVLGSVAALGGLALLTDAFGSGRHSALYEAVAVLTAVASAYVVITIRRLHATDNSATIFSSQCVYGVLVCLVPVLVHPPSPSGTAWVLMGVAGLCTAGGQLSMTRAYRDLDVAEGTLLQMLVPVGVALGGSLLFQEHLSVRELAGGVLILLGTGVTAFRGRKGPGIAPASGQTEES
ncbi:MAG: DMT family transporter [Verrucomicrobiales bacterium]|nr:DMT family transporter [Verrucomicrobiales bacterium]